MNTVVDFDDILKEIAKALNKHSEIYDVGIALGFEPADIDRTIKDKANQEGNNMETLDLLRTWRNRQTPSTEKAALRSALLKGRFANLALEYLSPLGTDKTALLPSSPNTFTSTSAATATPTTAAATTTSTTSTTTTTTQKAFLVILLLTWAAVSVSGTTTELSKTIGDTVNIPCFFGEGTLRYILIEWYYNDSTGHRMILKPANGDLIIGAGYENRASLPDDSSTLILKEISVADEGTYHCVVNTLKQTEVSNIKTKLNVFGLRPDMLPVILPCTRADASSSCRIHANQSFIITCTIPNVYPVENTELIWYQDGKHVSYTHDVTQNSDGTTDISRHIRVSETGNFTCNATYLSVNGTEKTAVSVEALIIPPLDIPNTPGKNMTSGQIAGTILGIVMLVSISLAIIILFLYRSKARESSEPTEQPAANSSKNEEEKCKLLWISEENGSKVRNVERSIPLLSSTVRRRNVNRTPNEERMDLLDGQPDIDPKEAIMNGTAPWNRSRIMVIGPAGAGKTSLIRRLTGQKFNPHEKSTKGVEQNAVTKNAVNSWELVNDAHTAKDDLIQSIAMDSEIRSNSQRSTGGEENRSDPEITDSNRSTLDENEKIANILQSITREEITKVKSSKVDITYSIWDFGGQEVYYITHPLFLSWRSLYILAIPLHLELSEEAPCKEDAENAPKPLKGSVVKTHRTILDLVHFWLMSVYTHAVPYSHLDSTYEPKVLIIGTFAGDKSTRISQEKVESKVQELKILIGSQPYQKQVLFPICVIDNKSSKRSEVNEIQDRIDGLIKDLEYMKVRKPVKRRTLLTEIESSAQDTLTVSKAHSMLKTWGINNDKEVDDVLKFYHEIGHLTYHQKGDQGKQWTHLKEKGILSIELVQDVWKEHKGDDDQLKNIINMMIKFDLICEIPEGSNGKRQFFVPCRSSPKLGKWEIHDKDENVEFTIDFHHFLPDGVLHRFYVRMAQWSMERNPSIKPTFHCREMMFFIDNVHRVVMTNEIHEGHEIKVTIYAVAPHGAPSERTKNTISLNEEIVDYLHETLENLKDLWARRIKYRVGIWCPRSADFECKGWIHIRDILKAQDKTACCDEGCAIYVGHFLKAFSKGPAKTSLGRTGASAAADEVSTSKARPTEESRKQDFDDHLKTVAKKIHKDIDINSLGKELGFEPEDIARYMKTNTKYQTITYMGSLSMLRDWRKMTKRSEENEKLKRALIAIKHQRLADDIPNDDMAIEESNDRR